MNKFPEFTSNLNIELWATKDRGTVVKFLYNGQYIHKEMTLDEVRSFIQIHYQGVDALKLCEKFYIRPKDHEDIDYTLMIWMLLTVILMFALIY
jgi:hypothetical protein